MNTREGHCVRPLELDDTIKGGNGDGEDQVAGTYRREFLISHGRGASKRNGALIVPLPLPVLPTNGLPPSSIACTSPH